MIFKTLVFYFVKTFSNGIVFGKHMLDMVMVATFNISSLFCPI